MFKQRCEIQLKRMKIETIDLYLTHFFDPLTALEEVTEAIGIFKNSTAKLDITVSVTIPSNNYVHSEDMVHMMRAQPFYSMVKKDIETDLLSFLPS